MFSEYKICWRFKLLEVNGIIEGLVRLSVGEQWADCDYSGGRSEAQVGQVRAMIGRGIIGRRDM